MRAVQLHMIVAPTPPRCECHPAPDRQWGAVDDEGSWSGMVGEMLAGKGDIIVATLDNTLARGRVLDFLAPLDLAGYLF